MCLRTCLRCQMYSPDVTFVLDRCLKFVYEEIREVHKRRYLLQPIAIEVFSVDGRNFLLAFPKKVRNKVHARWVPLWLDVMESFLCLLSQHWCLAIECYCECKMFVTVIKLDSYRWLYDCLPDLVSPLVVHQAVCLLRLVLAMAARVTAVTFFLCSGLPCYWLTHFLLSFRYP